MKFTAYEYAIYGGLDGKVEYISPTRSSTRGRHFYTVRVKTAKTTLGQNRPILPGMVAQVDVVIGKKTVLSYILKPLFRAKKKLCENTDPIYQPLKKTILAWRLKIMGTIN